MNSRGLEVDVRLSLDSFDLRVDFETDGPVTGIFGPSGSGKTSLLEALAGLRRGALGRLRLGGEAWLDSATGLFVPPERRAIGYVPQDGLLFPHWNVRQNLLAGARRIGSSKPPRGTSLVEVAELLGLEPLLDRRVRALSGGERQRVALGRALCSGPRLLLLDEPFASLDLPLRRRLLPVLRRLRRALTVPMLLVSHDPTEVQALCDDLIVLEAGQVVARGAPREVLTDPKVFPLAEAEGFENLLPGELRETDTGRRVRLGEGGPELVVASGSPGEVLVGVPATEIVLARERPLAISARNVLPAVVREVRPFGDRALVVCQIEGALPSVIVEVTAATPAALGLEPEVRSYLVIKATACRVYGRR